jgi:hypothetical protein
VITGTIFFEARSAHVQFGTDARCGDSNKGANVQDVPFIVLSCIGFFVYNYRDHTVRTPLHSLVPLSVGRSQDRRRTGQSQRRFHVHVLSFALFLPCGTGDRSATLQLSDGWQQV